MIAYIDGFNLYFGLMDGGMRNRLWLDLVALSRRLADHRQLKQTKYYTARVRRPVDSVQRQGFFLDALQAKYPTDLVINYGFLQYEPWECLNCKRSTERRTEKRTDVNLAVDMVADAFNDEYDTAMLISGDADQAGAIERCQALGKQVIVAFPPTRASDHLRDVADGSFTISRTKIRQCALPEVVGSLDGRRFERPMEWS